MRLGFLNKQLLSMWCSPLPLRLARVDSQRFVFAAPLRPAPSSIAPFHGPFSTTICSRPHGNNPLKTTGLQSTTATQWIAPLSRVSIGGPRSFLCSPSNYVAWTVGRVGIKRGRWLTGRENVGMIGWKMQLSSFFPLFGIFTVIRPYPTSPRDCHKLHVYFTSCTAGPLAEEVNYRILAASLSALTADGSRARAA